MKVTSLFKEINLELVKMQSVCKIFNEALRCKSLFNRCPVEMRKNQTAKYSFSRAVSLFQKRSHNENIVHITSRKRTDDHYQKMAD